MPRNLRLRGVPLLTSADPFGVVCLFCLPALEVVPVEELAVVAVALDDCFTSVAAVSAGSGVYTGGTP